MSLRSRDVLVALKLASSPETGSTFAELAAGIGLATSAVHRSIKRLEEARLVDSQARRPREEELLEFLIHGVKYSFYGRLGGIVRGIPTAHGAEPLSSVMRGTDLPPVWPDPHGTVRGQALNPLDPIAPLAAGRDDRLYELLALVDAVRIGQARERSLAAEMLAERLATRSQHRVSHA